MVDKVKGGVKRGCVHFDTPSFCNDDRSNWAYLAYGANTPNITSFIIDPLYPS